MSEPHRGRVSEVCELRCPEFWPFVTASRKLGWDRVVGELISPGLMLLLKPLSPQSSCVFLCFLWNVTFLQFLTHFLQMSTVLLKLNCHVLWCYFVFHRLLEPNVCVAVLHASGNCKHWGCTVTFVSSQISCTVSSKIQVKICSLTH